MPDLGVRVHTDCTRHVGGGQFLCKCCRPGNASAAGLIPQSKMVGAVVEESADAFSSQTSYLVECYDPAEPEKPFEFVLPRKEVDPQLLEKFELATLPTAGKKKQRPPAWVKSAK